MQCKNCGAPLNNANADKCEYCNSTITLENYDWTLGNIERTIR